MFDLGLVFKGGTCLSKVHAVFFRLSEDLDFAVSISPAASRSERRRMAAPFKAHFAAISSRLPCFRMSERIDPWFRDRHYKGSLSYESAVTGEAESIKLEISLREEIIRPTQILAASTLLLSPHTGLPAMRPASVHTLSIEEAYAEKIRAALTRRGPAIRDFFDVDHAIRSSLLNPSHPSLLGLVRMKLAVEGNDPVDLSPSRLERLRVQVEAQLRPVLRDRDYLAFDLDRVVRSLEELVGALAADHGY
ncbi:nucleotidyl transferase AbiEii/AbiGii toxin family protein [Aquisphaera insulae]|uniref:nucleotidyl transferase AbiEii/AbiGii toxin family protein n=1 Tax=Aquisphaera insulae TaxID=2712864 RepID=UPI0013EDB9E6|nr:nucleotidyl transferase AbiEii/AbiGii toxin family protein [Aquisphaera insulae]